MEEARDLDACLESRLDARETPLELELNKLRQFLEEGKSATCVKWRAIAAWGFPMEKCS